MIVHERCALVAVVVASARAWVPMLCSQQSANRSFQEVRHNSRGVPGLLSRFAVQPEITGTRSRSAGPHRPWCRFSLQVTCHPADHKAAQPTVAVAVTTFHHRHHPAAAAAPPGCPGDRPIRRATVGRAARCSPGGIDHRLPGHRPDQMPHRATSLGIDGGDVQVGEAVGCRDDVDSGDLVLGVRDRECQGEGEPSAGRHH